MKSSRKHDGDNAYLTIDYKESKQTANNCINFIECLPVPSGALAGQGKLIKLMSWQKKLIQGIWPLNGKPRNEVLLSIARRNGKSVLLSAIMAFLLFNRHKNSAPVQGGLFVSAACNREQASFIFDILALWCATVVDLDDRSDISHYHRIINITDIPGVRYKAIAANARAALGGQYSVVICDEIGFWRDNKLQLALRSGMASTPPDKRLFLQASTVPDQAEHFFYDELKYFQRRQNSPDHYALVMMTNPKVDLPSKVSTWKKANPSYDILVNKESFVSEYKSALAFPQRMLGFVSYRCNSPVAPLVDDSARFLDRNLWNDCEGVSQLKSGEPIVVAWDASVSQSLTAVVAMSIEQPHRTECLFIVPRNVVTKATGVPYRLWAEQGYCRLAQTDFISKQFIVDHYQHLRETYDIVASQSDLYGWGEIQQIAEQQNVDMSIHIARHTRVADYHDGLEKLAELIAEKQVLHNNPVLTYCVDNMRTKRTKTGAIVIDRELSIKNRNLIDGGICLLLCCLLVAGSTPVSNEINYEGLVLR